MACQYLIIVLVFFVINSSAAPWEINEGIREFDIEWQCEQFCNRLNGQLTYNPKDFSCSCKIGPKSIDMNTNHLEEKLNNLGFNFKIEANDHKNKIIKRETPAEKLKKLIAERKETFQNKNEAPAILYNVEENEQKEENNKPINEKILKLRAKLQNAKSELNLSDKKIPENPTPILSNAQPEKQENLPNDKLNKLRSKLDSMKDSKSTQSDSNKDGQKDEKKIDNIIEKKAPQPKRLQLLKSKLQNKHTGLNDDKKHLSDKAQELRERVKLYIENHRAKKIIHT